ncbi:DNA-binding transcriptional regulator, LysR family [Carboxydocella sporoproducens DSM 16521]|uniref:DNA-binding transcriptional regulator, LysR family n=2 Tax=Carboxydocella TaxID=178898 RepID=A0A1T4Q9R6_9FIRM|nr:MULTISPECIES: LysR family transcriptional regulator [Carboxydocella]AVX19353.1 DNA-binding transcriptional regulator, LysR family [Carboxydocella thermautotrophica]SKA00444.1 DNA-binding transcriptional regulator, LysR family [Carboxydocella sporoproducens DSM 16521]
MNISFELYKVFYHVAKSLSFSAAARELFISQSAVSQNIKALEEQLGCSLFSRHTKQVRLTREGEVLFQHIEQAYLAIKTAERTLDEMRTLARGEVRLGATDTICKHFLLHPFQHFSQLYPQLKLRVTNTTSPGCLDLLSRGLVDLAVIHLPEKELPANLQAVPLQELNYGFIAGPQYRQLQGQTLTLEEIVTYPLLLLEKATTTRNLLDQLLAAHNLSVQPEIESGSIDLLVELTKIGLGLTFLPLAYVQAELASGQVFLLPLELELPRRHLGVVTRSDFPLPLAAGKFMELLIFAAADTEPAEQLPT